MTETHGEHKQRLSGVSLKYSSITAEDFERLKVHSPQSEEVVAQVRKILVDGMPIHEVAAQYDLHFINMLYRVARFIKSINAVTSTMTEQEFDEVVADLLSYSPTITPEEITLAKKVLVDGWSQVYAKRSSHVADNRLSYVLWRIRGYHPDKGSYYPILTSEEFEDYANRSFTRANTLTVLRDILVNGVSIKDAIVKHGTSRQAISQLFLKFLNKAAKHPVSLFTSEDLEHAFYSRNLTENEKKLCRMVLLEGCSYLKAVEACGITRERAYNLTCSLRRTLTASSTKKEPVRLELKADELKEWVNNCFTEGKTAWYSFAHAYHVEGQSLAAIAKSENKYASQVVMKLMDFRKDWDLYIKYKDMPKQTCEEGRFFIAWQNSSYQPMVGRIAHAIIFDKEPMFKVIQKFGKTAKSVKSAVRRMVLRMELTPMPTKLDAHHAIHKGFTR